MLCGAYDAVYADKMAINILRAIYAASMSAQERCLLMAHACYAIRLFTRLLFAASHTRARVQKAGEGMLALCRAIIATPLLPRHMFLSMPDARVVSVKRLTIIE